MPMNLTDTALTKYKPKTDRDEIFDKQVKGFGVRVTPTSKAFFFVRRVKGQKVRFSLGQYPSMSLAEARKQAFDILHKIQKGSDPRDEYGVRRREQAEQETDTFAHVAKRFITEYAEGKRRPLSKRTIEGYKWALQGDQTAKWASRPLAEIADGDVIKIIDRLEAEKHFASARLFRAYVHKFFRWCIGKRLIRINPAVAVPLGSEPADFKRDRHLSIAELQTVLEAADEQAEPTRGFLWMLIFTGQRRGETSLMKRSDLTLDGEAPVWRIPATNAKNRQAHSVPLSSETVDAIKRVPAIGEYVFTTNGETPISGFSKIKAKIDKALREAGHKIEPWRLHDLRRSVSTGLGELGFAPHIIEMVLNHISGEKSGVSGLYNRSRYEADCRRALAAWAMAVTVAKTNNVILLASHNS